VPRQVPFIGWPSWAVATPVAKDMSSVIKTAMNDVSFKVPPNPVTCFRQDGITSVLGCIPLHNLC